LIHLVFNGVLESGLFEPDGSDIKVRAISYLNYRVGNSCRNFIHITLKILSGRSVENKRVLVESVLNHLKTEVLENCSITVEVVDIDFKTYKKVLM